MLNIIYPKCKNTRCLPIYWPLSHFCTLDIWQNPLRLSPSQECEALLKNVQSKESEVRVKTLFWPANRAPNWRTHWSFWDFVLCKCFHLLESSPLWLLERLYISRFHLGKAFVLSGKEKKLVPWATLTLMRNKARAQQCYDTRKCLQSRMKVTRCFNCTLRKGQNLMGK